MSTLVVPIHLDALLVGAGREVIGPSTNFDVQPWFDGERDRYPSTPNVAGALTPEPFGEGGLWLESGVHLHWALPDGLTRGSTSRTTTCTVQVDDLWFPPAPNRWQVINRRRGSSWMVESDYVHPGDGRPRRSVAYPRTNAPVGTRPWVWLGREQRFDVDAPWVEPSTATPERYLPGIDAPLTAVGSGDPLFAALYANSRSVFGSADLFDPTGFESRFDRDSYVVVGWYSPQVVDPVGALVADVESWSDRDIIGRINFERARAVDPAGPKVELYEQHHVPTWADVVEAKRLALADRLGWHVDVDGSTIFPVASVFVGRIDLDDGRSGGPPDEISDAPVVLGTTATEAIATLVGLAVHDPAVEDQLEAAAWGPVADHHALDVRAKFREFRHDQQFHVSGGRRVWTARAARATTDEAPGSAVTGTTAPAVAPQGEVQLPAPLAHELNILNEAQGAYEDGVEHLDGSRRQLFSDWYRYMLVAYPSGELDEPVVDIDALVRLITDSSLPAVEDSVARLGTLHVARDDHAGSWTFAHEGDDTIAAALVAQLRRLGRMVDDHNATRPSGQQVELALTPGSRYWRTNDPVVAFRHPGEAPSRHGRDGRGRDDGRLTCVLGNDLDRLSVSRIPEDLLSSDASRALSASGVAVREQGERSWNSVAFEWQAEVEAAFVNGNQRLSGRGYDPAFIESNYSLVGTELAVPPGRALALAPALEYVSGRAVLVNDVASVVVDRLRDAIGRIEAAAAHPVDGVTPPAVPPALSKAQSWLDDNGDNVVTASLGGFHDALLSMTSQPQLPIADPIGFPDQQELAGRVQEALRGHHHGSPQPDDPFHPIRSGALVLQRVRLIDTFGQTAEWRPTGTPVSAAFRPPTPAPSGGEAAPSGPQVERRCMLPPRFSQGAMVDVRWLSAVDGEVESNDHPASTPICGWFLPNELDGVLQVHETSGELLGSIDEDGVWSAAPGAARPVVFAEDIASEQLRRVVLWVVRSSDPSGRMAALQATVADGSDATDPTDYAQHPSRALLVGRPVAVARARLALRLQGDPATDQSWEALRRRLLGGPPDDHGFPAVRLPIVIGDASQLNDGLIGYWLEDDGTLGDDLQTAVEVSGSDDHRGTAGPLWRSASDPPADLTLLIDPRAPVHASSPVQPTQAIAIPPDHFAEHLAAMRVTFATMPLLTPTTAVTVPLPNESGYAWAWLQRDRGGWSTVPEHPSVFADDLERAFPGRGVQLWQQLVRQGVIVPADASGGWGRLQSPAPDATVDVDPELLKALSTIARGVRPMSVRATFGVRTMIREGWLQLRPVQGGSSEGGSP